MHVFVDSIPYAAAKTLGLERVGLDVPVYHLAEVLESSALAGDELRR